MMNIIKKAKDFLTERKNDSKQIYRIEKLIKQLEAIEDDRLTSYVFEMLLRTAKNDYTFEIFIPKTEKGDMCTFNEPSFKINGKAYASVYNGNISEALRRAYETYQLEGNV